MIAQTEPAPVPSLQDHLAGVKKGISLNNHFNTTNVVVGKDFFVVYANHSNLHVSVEITVSIGGNGVVSFEIAGRGGEDNSVPCGTFVDFHAPGTLVCEEYIEFELENFNTRKAILSQIETMLTGTTL